MSKPVAVVVGATGGQGSSVIASFLEDGSYQVRGITRNIHSEKAKALSQRGVEVVYGDLNDKASLVKAFKNATVIYAVTDFFEPLTRKGPELAVEIETEQGTNLAKAASETPTLKHYIWSTLPNASRISGGKYVIPHFEGKNKIDDWIKNDPILLPKTTFLWVTYYASNLLFPLFKPNFLKSSGKYVWLQPTPPTTEVIAIGDPNKNVGPFVVAIVKKPELTLPGKFVLATADKLTKGEILEAWGEVTGKPTEYVEITLADFDRLFPKWGQEMGWMLKFWEEFGGLSWSGEETITKEDLGITAHLGGVKEALGTFDWTDV